MAGSGATKAAATAVAVAPGVVVPGVVAPVAVAAAVVQRDARPAWVSAESCLQVRLESRR